MQYPTTFTIRIRVPDQDFDAIRLVVDASTTFKEVKKEVVEQLYETTPRYMKRRTMLRACPTPDSPQDKLFMSHWTAQRVLALHSGDFELVYTDLIQ